MMCTSEDGLRGLLDAWGMVIENEALVVYVLMTTCNSKRRGVLHGCVEARFLICTLGAKLAIWPIMTTIETHSAQARFISLVGRSPV